MLQHGPCLELRLWFLRDFMPVDEERIQQTSSHTLTDPFDGGRCMSGGSVGVMNA